MKIKTMIMGFKINKSLTLKAEKIRGFFASKFKEYILTHQHKSDGSFLYKYPLIQYKIINNTPYLIAIEDGCDVINNIYDKYSKIRIENFYYAIIEKSIIVKCENLGLSKKEYSYEFLTPWLALNEKNFKKYMEIEEEKDKKEFLNKILTGNIISLSKSLGYTVEKVIEAKILKFKEVPVKLKGVKMIGFLGSFRVNFEIPDYFGLGKSVSRGFGTIKKINSNISSTPNGSK